MRRIARPFLNLVIAVGLLISVWPIGQTIYGLWSQRSLAAQWQQNESAAPHSRQTTKKPVRATKAKKAASKVALAEHDPNSPAPLTSIAPKQEQAPWPLTKLSIPDIGLETFIVQGMDAPSLRRGPGHDANSSPPGAGNCVVAGHRNVYGSFFYRLDELQPGAQVTLENRDGTFNYIVQRVFITPDTDLTVLNLPATGQPAVLTLITCTLPHTNNRMILQASLSSD